MNEHPNMYLQAPPEGLLSPKKLSKMQLAQPRYDNIRKAADPHIGEYYDLRVRHARVNASDNLLTP